MTKIEELIEQKHLKKIKPDEKLVKKEFGEAEYDLKKAKHALGDDDYKWCIVKAYYSMFHSARAILFLLGLKERRHFAIVFVLEDLSRKGMLEFKFVNDFKGAIDSREDADYRYIHTKDTAEYMTEIAEDFLKKMKELSKRVKPNEI